MQRESESAPSIGDLRRVLSDVAGILPCQKEWVEITDATIRRSGQAAILAM